MKIPVVLITNEGFAPYCATVMASILRNSVANTEVSFYILTTGLPQVIKDRFYGLKEIKECSVEFVHINREDFNGFPICHHIQVESYYRFKLFSSFPDLNKVLYLDSDVVVLGDLTDLFEINIDEYCAGMAIDAVKNIGEIIPNVNKKLHRPPNSDYFNSGVMLVNLKKCREYNIEQKLFEWVNGNREKLTWADQDVLNVVLSGLIKEIPEEFNVQLSFRNTNVRLAELSEPKTIHYCGANKPWNTKGMFLSEHFWENYYPFCAVQ